jgi:hypothetical protein
MKQTRHIAVVLALMAGVAFGRGLNDGIGYSIPPDHPMLKSPFFVLLVVSADQINPGPHSNRNPPRGVFSVHEVLRGHFRAERVELEWTPSETPEDHVNGGPGEPRYQDWYRQPKEPEWYDRSLPAPEVGEKIIVFAAVHASTSSELPYLDVRAAYRLTEENRHTVLRNMEPTDRHPTIQGYVLVIVALLAAASVTRLGWAFQRSAPGPRRALVHGAALCAASLLMYIYFEVGNRTGGIRVDLLLIYPILLFNFGVLIVACIWLAVRRSRGRTQEPSGAGAGREGL